jgi:PAS domain S-box-containing protein
MNHAPEKDNLATSILESITDGFFAVDREWRFTYVNRQAERILGRARGDLIGRLIWDAFPGLAGSEFERIYLRAANEGSSSSVTSYFPDHDRWYEVHANPASEGISIYFSDVSERVHAEAAIREGEERHRLIMANVTDHAIFTLGLDGRITEWNAGAEKVFGHGREIIGRPADILFTPEDRDAGRVEQELRLCLVSGRASDERWHIKKDGTRFFASGSMESLRGEDGVLRGFVKVVRDQTERVKAEGERQALTARIALQARLFDTALSNSPDFIYTFDLEGRFTYINRSLLELLRKSADQAVGRNFFDLGYPPELAARLQRQIQEVIETRGHVQDETPYTGASGTRDYEYIFVPVLAPDGTVEAVAGSTRDITGRKQAEEATRRRALQLQKLADVATRVNSARDVNSVVGVVTEEARTIIGARQAATSMVLNPNYSQPINVISTPETRPHVPASAVVDALMLCEVANAEFRTVRLTQDDLGKDPRWQALGKVALVVPTDNGWLSAPLVGRDGKGIGLLQLADKLEGAFTDDDEAILVQLSRLAAIAIENARLYEELRGNDQRKDEFLAMLAHELRNPLAAIGNAVNVSTRTGLHEHFEWSMDVITRQMKHLTRLIDDLMDVSRISRGKIQLRKDLLDATPILDSATATVKTLVEERKHALDVSIDRGNLWVHADPTRIEQVVVNLLNNAAKYSENAGHIWLSARNEGGEVVISVRDRGVGIPSDKLPKMFELFAQGDRSLARSEGGLGIGLTVVKKLVEMHGGRVTAESEGPGKGSEFTIRLPAARRPATTSVEETGPSAAASKKSRILVVDDNVDTARGMARLLKLLGNEVATAHTGSEALKVAREHRPEFILLDIGLPGMDGYEVASRLRLEECCKDAVIVAVSGYGQEEDRRRSKEAGFDHHLIKPLDHDALLSLLSAGAADK